MEYEHPANITHSLSPAAATCSSNVLYMLVCFRAAFDAKHTDQAKQDVAAAFLFSLIWSVGGSLMPDNRTKLDAFVRELAMPGVELLPDDSVFDYHYDVSDGRWRPWLSLSDFFAAPLHQRVASGLCSAPSLPVLNSAPL